MEALPKAVIHPTIKELEMYLDMIEFYPEVVFIEYPERFLMPSNKEEVIKDGNSSQ